MWEVITCCDCQLRFKRLVADAQWFARKGLTPAIRCKHCRSYRLTARLAGDDPDGLFPLASNAEEYRALRNQYVVGHQEVLERLKEKRRALKAAQVLLASHRRRPPR